MKNPWLSLWLSGANAWTGAARGVMAGEARRAQTAMMAEAARQQSAMIEEATRTWTELWLPGAKTPAKRKTRRPSRRAS